MRLLFAITLLLSASLIFFVEPLFSRVGLPAHGGVPAVWTTCLVLFQTTLLAGYLYAHLLARVPLRIQALAHVALAWAGWAYFALGGGIGVSSTGDPVLALSVAFLGSIAPPFFILAATTPLLQRWYSLGRGDADASQPYVFYAVSNLGSLVALLAYPLLAEPSLGLSTLAELWSIGLAACAALISACAAFALATRWRMSRDRREPAQRGTGGSARGATRERLRWLALSAVPSSLLLGATSHITTDVASVPLFWVVPLAVYLASFVLVFAGRPPVRHRWMLALQSLTVLPILAFYLVQARTRLWIDLPLHLLALFAAAMVCHGELARSKPPASRLTEFYLWLAGGGCLGGILTALVAPQVFDTVIEYPMMILAACLARPVISSGRATTKVLAFLAALAVALLLLPVAWSAADRRTTLVLGAIGLLLVTSLGGALLFHFLTTPRRVGLVLGAIFCGGLLLSGAGRQVLHQRRSFFGTVRVSRSADGRFHLMHHGTTLHGAQRRDRAHRREPLTYFGREGPLGDLFATLAGRRALAIAVAGLGVGTVATYARPGDRITFYEIDRDVIAAASRAEWFSYLADCPGALRVVLGDARVRIGEAADGAFGLIVHDAFSSDAIPVHLLTLEALALYRRKLARDGLMAFNITNRHVDLEPQLAASLKEQRLQAVIRHDDRPHDDRRRGSARRRQLWPSTWIVAARRRAALAPLTRTGRWRPLRGRPRAVAWTDDYSAILPYLK